MKLVWEPVTLNLRTTFRIAHGASDQRHNVVARLYDEDGLEGLGEAAAVAYHGETQSGIMEYLASIAGSLGEDPFQIEDILDALQPGSRAGKAAIDICLHDLLGKRLEQPLYRLLGTNPTKIPQTSFTIAMDTPERMAQQARDSGFQILKIKAGGQDDEAVLAAIRAATPARLRVDANAGWTSEQAARMIPRLAEFGLELVEQPLPIGDISGLRELRASLRAQRIDLPLFADENVKSARDVAVHAGAVDGVVIKLMKTGGIREALRAIHTARSLDLQVMLSCMVETSLGVTAAAHLAPLCDLVDLDGPLLIANDPYEGVRYDGARIILPDMPGIGVKSRGSG